MNDKIKESMNSRVSMNSRQYRTCSTSIWMVPHPMRKRQRSENISKSMAMIFLKNGNPIAPFSAISDSNR